MKKIIILCLALVITVTGFSQRTEPAKKEGWHLLDPKKDGYMGISLDEAYELLKGRRSETVIVAVIDSGVDTAQEDLQGILWNNPREIPGNGIDDDHNGYVDDVHGWNFDGNRNGENLARNSHEIERVYHTWKGEFGGMDSTKVPPGRQYLYGQWKKAKALIDADYNDAGKQLPEITNTSTILDQSSSVLFKKLNMSEFNQGLLKPLLQDSSEMVRRSAALWDQLFTNYNSAGITSTNVLNELKDYKGSLENKVNLKLQAPQDWRGAITGDRADDINDRSYGNNNLKTGSGDHGTLVSGTIAAVRHNQVGMDGIADNVRIMAVRAVPGGDEHDKDVALAIRYAVDNGAKVVNMSFGKPVSPYKSMVDDAVKYAQSKGVLLVHGSGNDGKDITHDVFYPNPVFLDGTRATNYLTVGASGDKTTGYYAAPFSNYSKTAVDIFAPGMFIYSTATGNRYLGADGTSLASPVASGVAALLRSYFPKLTPEQVIHIMVTTGTPIPGEVGIPGHDEQLAPFSTLSVSGKVINAADAVKMALEMEKRKN